MTHYIYQPGGRKTVPLKTHCPRSSVLGGTFDNGNCDEVQPTLWQHVPCEKTDYLDGRGYIYCECNQTGRCIFDATFQCGSDNEFYYYSNYLDVVRANAAILMGMTGSNMDAEERAGFANWVVALNAEITRRGTARGRV